MTGRTTNKRSMAAQAVARDVLESVGNGEKPRLGEIAYRHGYAVTTAGASIVTRTKSYRETIYPVVEAMERERRRAIEAMAGKISKARYRDLTDAADKLTKNIQLLTGGATSHVAVKYKQMSDAELEQLADAQAGSVVNAT